MVLWMTMIKTISLELTASSTLTPLTSQKPVSNCMGNYFIFESGFSDVPRVVKRIETLNSNFVENEGKISRFFNRNTTEQETMVGKPP